jgi:hypothetical protein
MDRAAAVEVEEERARLLRDHRERREAPGLRRELAGPSPRSLNFFSDVHWKPLFEEFSPNAGKLWIEPHGMG